MTRVIFFLVATTVAFSLAAQSSQDKKIPLEIQIGASSMWYGDHWPDAKKAYAPSIRFSVDILPFCLGERPGSLLFSAGYRFGNSVSGEYIPPRVGDVKHDGQFQFGALARIEAMNNFEVGLGLDMRNDQLKARQLRTAESVKESDFKPWLRFTARYMFNKGNNITPFVGFEMAGRPNPDAARNYFPEREFALVGGLKFGRRAGNKCTQSPHEVMVAVFPEKIDVSEVNDKGESIEALAMLQPPHDSDSRIIKYKWKSSNENIATVRPEDNSLSGRRAVVIPHKPGTVTITASAVGRDIVFIDGYSTVEVHPVEKASTTVIQVAVAEALSGMTVDAEQVKKYLNDNFKSLRVHFETREYELKEESKISIDKWINEVWKKIAEYAKNVADAEVKKVADDARDAEIKKQQAQGNTVIIDDEFNKHHNELIADKIKEMDVWLKSTLSEQQNRFLIIGNCDPRNEEINDELSKNRAESLAKYLSDKHNLNKISKIEGHASRRAIIKGTTQEAYAKNRYAQVLLDIDDERYQKFGTHDHIEGPLVGAR